MDAPPPLDELLDPLDMTLFTPVQREDIQVGKYYYSIPREDWIEKALIKVLDLPTNDRTDMGDCLIEYEWKKSGPRGIGRWKVVPYKNRNAYFTRDLYLPFSIKKVETLMGTKAQVQAVKDVLAKKGVPDEMGTGPLGNILKMADIKTPPKGSTAGRRTRKHTKRSRKTRRR